MSVLVHRGAFDSRNFQITIGRNPATEQNSLATRKHRSRPLNLAKLNQTIQQGRSQSQNAFQALKPKANELPKHHTLISSSSGPGPCLNYFSRTYGPKFDNKNVGNNFLGIYKHKSRPEV